jgi:hypothetical protein
MLCTLALYSFVSNVQDTQVLLAMEQLRLKTSDIEKYIYLQSLQVRSSSVTPIQYTHLLAVDKIIVHIHT